MIYENIISLHVSLIVGTVCQTILWVCTINQFKACLDEFWMHQDVLYDCTADLTEIGDRTVHETLRCYTSVSRCRTTTTTILLYYISSLS